MNSLKHLRLCHVTKPCFRVGIAYLQDCVACVNSRLMFPTTLAAMHSMYSFHEQIGSRLQLRNTLHVLMLSQGAIFRRLEETFSCIAHVLRKAALETMLQNQALIQETLQRRMESLQVRTLRGSTCYLIGSLLLQLKAGMPSHSLACIA